MKSALAALVLVLLGLVGWLVLSEPQPAVEPAAPELAMQEESTDKPGKLAPTLARAEEPASEPQAVLEDSQRAEVAVEPIRVEVAAAVAMEMSPAAETGDMYEVVIEGTEQPLPGALLSALRIEDSMRQQWEELFAAGAGIDGALDVLGTHYRCDENGQVVIAPLLGRKAMIRARGELDGVLYTGIIDPGDDTKRLFVRPDVAFGVTVVDRQGAPVSGITVELRIRRGERGDGMDIAVGSSATDSEGGTTVANFFLQMSEEAERMFDESRRNTSAPMLCLSGLYGVPVESKLNWRETTPRETRFVRPDVGIVEVAAVDPSGTSMIGGGVFITVAGAPFNFDNGMASGAVQQMSGESGTELFVFENIERAVPIDVRYVLRNGEVLLESMGLAIPVDTGILRVELKAQSKIPRIVGRALREDGEPHALVEISFGWRKGSRKFVRNFGKTLTDEAGHFEVLAPWYEENDLGIYRTREDGTEEFAMLELGTPDADGVLNLGDIVVAPLPILVAGRVVDSDGSPLEVLLTLRTNMDAVGAVDFGRSLELEATGLGPGDFRHARWNVTSKPDGSFEFRGETAAPSFQLSASSESYLVPPVFSELPIKRDDRTVEVVLEKGARFTFTLDEPNEHILNELQLVVRPVGIGMLNTRALQSPAKAGMSRLLFEGDYEFVVLLQGSTDAVVYSSSVQLAAGEIRDLGHIALTVPVYFYEVRIVSAGGEPVLGAYVREMTSIAGQSTGSARRKRTMDGIHRLFSLTPLASVTMNSSLGSQAFSIVEGDNEVVWSEE